MSGVELELNKVTVPAQLKQTEEIKKRNNKRLVKLLKLNLNNSLINLKNPLMINLLRKSLNH